MPSPSTKGHSTKEENAGGGVDLLVVLRMLGFVVAQVRQFSPEPGES